MDYPSLVILSLFVVFFGSLFVYSSRFGQKLSDTPLVQRLRRQLKIDEQEKAAFRTRQVAAKTLARLEKTPLKYPIKIGRRRPKGSLVIIGLVLFHAWLHLSNPYATINFVQQPYTTKLEHGEIVYTQHYKTWVWSNPLADLLGYYKSGFLIVQNTFFGGKRIQATNSEAIISEIHQRRFDPSKPYLISGDQFSVLYPRNLGVFYNQLLDPNTAHSQTDWENRQRIYLQSALYAIDGLADSDTPKTTIIPIAPGTVISTQVHPGDVASDSVYGLLFALDTMSSSKTSKDDIYKIQTKRAIQQILKEKKSELKHIVTSYVSTVRDSKTGFIKSNINLAAARDGVTRKSSFYDNVVLWKTLHLADKLGIHSTSAKELARLKATIKARYWNEKNGYYNNDSRDAKFSSDWLIGYVSGFFDLHNSIDRERTKRTIDYINAHNIAKPLPIKYQVGAATDAPFIIETFVPLYGSEAIWSYWGAQYITLLADMGEMTSQESYLKQARQFTAKYDEAIVRDGGFAETFSPDGLFFKHGLYKSIRITGWVVQFEHAKEKLRLLER